jgi:hypothetical protein
MTGLQLRELDQRSRIWEMTMSIWDLAQKSIVEPRANISLRRSKDVTGFIYTIMGREFGIRRVCVSRMVHGRITITAHMIVSREDGSWSITLRQFDLVNRYRWIDKEQNGLFNGEEGKTRQWFCANRRLADKDFFGRALIFFEGDKDAFEQDFTMLRVAGAIT